MKICFSLSALILGSLASVAQSKSDIKQYIALDVLIEASELADQGEYEDAIAEYDVIHPADTAYNLALYHKSRALTNLEEYDKVVALCQENIEKHGKSNPYWYSLYANALDSLGREAEAIEVCDLAIKKWPFNYDLFYAKGLALEDLGRLEEAASNYKESIRCNPLVADAHYKLGHLTAKEGLLPEAMLCLNTYLLLELEDAERGLATVVWLDNTAGGDYEPKPTGAKLLEEGAASMDEIKLLIENRVALNKKYKVKSKLNFNLTKQNHLLLSSVHFDENDPGFWNQMYVPFYEKMMEDEKFELFSYFSSLHVNSTQMNQIFAKYKPKLLAFRDYFIPSLANNTCDMERPYRGEPKMVHVIRNDYGGILVIGEVSDEKLQGYVEIFHANGNIAAKGEFNDQEEKTGAWEYFHNTGAIKEQSTYANDKLTGKSTLFYDNGHLSEVNQYIRGDRNGRSRYYNYNGTLEYEIYFKDNKLHGEWKSFFPGGQIQTEMQFENDEQIGEVKEYFTNGRISRNSPRKDGERDGMVKEWYSDGSIYLEMPFVDGEQHGAFKKFYQSGQLLEEGMYSSGKLSGQYKSYYLDGSLESETVYDESGKQNGVGVNYNRKGTKFYELDYKKGEVVGYRFWNEKGELLSEGKKKAGKFYYKSIYSDGTIKAEGDYEVGDIGKSGDWKYYDRNGNLTLKESFKDGFQVGREESYYTSGQLEEYVDYSDEGLLEGYSESYFKDGKIANHGYYKSGQADGEWLYYRNDGTLSRSSFYSGGNLVGKAVSNAVNGRPWTIDTYRDQQVISIAYCDTLGNIYESFDLDTGTVVLDQHDVYGNLKCKRTYVNYEASGTWLYYHPNGKVSTEANWVNGERDGVWTWYHDNGQISSKGEYYLGDRHGKWVAYFPDGKLEQETEYFLGHSVGKEVNYHSSGKISSEWYYVEGIKHGDVSFYDPEGKLQQVRRYDFGKIVAISWLGTDGKLVPFQEIVNETGTVESKYANGKVSRTYSVEGGDFYGPYLKYYDNGQVWESSTYVDDERDGEFLEYYKTGKIKVKANYVKDERQGLYSEYHSNGKMMEKVSYLNNEKHGVQTEYNSSGKAVLEKEFYNGNLIRITKL